MSDKESKKDGKDKLKAAREAFRLCAEAEDHNRKAALDDIKFARLAEQWPDEVKKQRERDGRPCLTINRMPAFIRQVVNDSRQNKPSIKVHPVDSNADPQTAEIIGGLIRNIEYTSNADVAYDTAIDSAVTGGLGYFRIGIDYAHDDSFDLDINIHRIGNPFTVYGDPHSTAADSSDWNVAFITEMVSKSDFKKKWNNAEEVNWDEYEGIGNPWIEEDSVMVAEWWTREEVDSKIVKLSDGIILKEDLYLKQKDLLDLMQIQVVEDRVVKSWKVKQTIMTGAAVLEETEWAGKYIPVVPVYGDEVNVEGKRYFRSLVADAKDPARMFNYWRTTSTELVALAPRVPYIGAKGAFNTDADKWATANTKNWAYIEYDGAQAPQRQPLDTGGALGAMQEASAASDDMKSIMGLHDASLGMRSNETSGRAILARQREGDTSTFHFIDNLSRAIRHAGRILIDLIPHVYTGERVIRVLGQDKKPKAIPLGKPTMTEEGVERIFDLTAGKYDLTVETGPSFNTKREESANQMLELVRAFPQAAPMIGDLLAKNLDWPGADEIAKRMEAMLPPMIKGQDPAAKQMQQAIQQLQGKLKEAMDDKGIETRKVDIDAYNAETNRIKAVGAGMSPEQVQAMVMQTIQQVLASPDILLGQPPPIQQNQPNQPPSGGFFMPNSGQITNPQGVMHDGRNNDQPIG